MGWRSKGAGEQGCRGGFHQKFFHLTDNLYKPALLGAGELRNSCMNSLLCPSAPLLLELVRASNWRGYLS